MPPKPPDPDHIVIFGLTAANLIAFGGIIVNLFWNWRNSRRDKTTRKNALAVDHFSSSVRAPLQELMHALAAHMDAADDIVLWGADLADQKKQIVDLTKTFHGTRRKLARLLTDYDQSPIVDGRGWATMEGADMDNATFALQQAVKASNSEDLRRELHSFVNHLQAIRDRLTSHLDNCAYKLMNS